MLEKYGKTLAAIVPVYNTEKYLPQCIGSLIKQTEPFDEILLIDDGSWDSSLDICKEFQDHYPNICIYSHENAGVSHARNIGIECCKSDYILFVDSDDMLDIQSVRLIKEKLDETDYDMVLYDADVIYEKGFERKKNPYDRSKWILEGEMSGKDFFRKMFPGCYTTVAYIAAYKRRYILNNHIWFPEGINYAEDTPFILQALLESDMVYYIPKKMYIRRYRENSITTSVVNEQKVKDSFCVAGKLADIFFEHIQHNQDCRDQYIALVLFHYSATVQICRVFEHETESFFGNDARNHFVKLFSFLKNTQHIWSKGDNISNMQMVLRLVEKFKPHGDRANQMECVFQENLNEHILRKLERLPFGENGITVIIYGTGVAAGKILSLYEERIGEIKSGLIFMKTETEIGETYNDLPVCSVKDIPTDAQYIIISSYKFRNEMKGVLKANNIRISVIDIYENEYFEILWREIGET